MEFRQVVHSVCRSAAVATRPSLASTRLPPSSILLQHHQFTTNSKQQLEATAAAVQPQSPPPLHTTTSPQYRVAQLRASLQSRDPSAIPPRPPPIRTPNAFEGTQRKRTPGWAAPQTKGAAGNSLFSGLNLTGRAPTNANGTSSSSAADAFNLPSQIASDMERSTGGSLSTWNENEFLPKHYDVSEPELRLRPSTGRTVHVKGNVDLARGFRLLQRAVSQNKIKTDVRLARHHERPALKRKRQKRERWQARFKNGFRAAISRVMELKAQGW